MSGTGAPAADVAVSSSACSDALGYHLRERSRREPLGAAGHLGHVHQLGSRATPKLRGQHGGPAFLVGQRDVDVPVEPARPDHRRVEAAKVVRRRHHHQLAHGPVLLQRLEELVDGASGLLVRVVVAPLGHRVELVEEEHARHVAESLAEDRFHIAGRLAPVRRHEVAGRDVQERQPELPRGRLGDERLAGARAAVKEDAVPCDAVGVGVVAEGEQEAERVLQLGLEGGHATDIGEGGQAPWLFDTGQVREVLEVLTPTSPAGGRGGRWWEAPAGRGRRRGERGQRAAGVRRPPPQQQPDDQRAQQVAEYGDAPRVLLVDRGEQQTEHEEQAVRGDGDQHGLGLRGRGDPGQEGDGDPADDRDDGEQHEPDWAAPPGARLGWRRRPAAHPARGERADREQSEATEGAQDQLGRRLHHAVPGPDATRLQHVRVLHLRELVSDHHDVVDRSTGPSVVAREEALAADEPAHDQERGLQVTSRKTGRAQLRLGVAELGQLRRRQRGVVEGQWPVARPVLAGGQEDRQHHIPGEQQRSHREEEPATIG